MRRGESVAHARLTAAQATAAESGAKGMMPLAGANSSRPFLDYVVSALADAGIRDVIFVIGPEQKDLREYYTGAGRPSRVTVGFALQAEARGTADAVLAARGVVRDAPFLVLNSDNYYPVD